MKLTLRFRSFYFSVSSPSPPPPFSILCVPVVGEAVKWGRVRGEGGWGELILLSEGLSWDYEKGEGSLGGVGDQKRPCWMDG